MLQSCKVTLTATLLSLYFSSSCKLTLSVAVGTQKKTLEYTTKQGDHCICKMGSLGRVIRVLVAAVSSALHSYRLGIANHSDRSIFNDPWTAEAREGSRSPA